MHEVKTGRTVERNWQIHNYNVFQPLPSINDQSSRQQISKDIEKLNNSIKQLDKIEHTAQQQQINIVF